MFAPLSIPSPDPAWQVFSLSQWLQDTFGVDLPFEIRIHAYAICILLGIAAAVWLTSRRLGRRGAEPGVVLDIALWAVPFGIIGGRIFHVLTHWDDYFGPGRDPMTAFYIWEGGLAIFGALMLGAVGVWLGCRQTGIRFWSFADALAPGLLLAQAFGRLGNYFNHELYGQPTDLPWGLEIESTNPAYPVGLPEGVLFHPTFLYEILWNLLGVAVILLLDRQFRLQWGRLLAIYLIWYGVGRAWFESIRIDPSDVYLGIRTNVWAALAAVALGIVIFIVQARRHPGQEQGPYSDGRERVDSASGVDSDETYSDSDDTGNDAADTSGRPATSGAGSKS